MKLTLKKKIIGLVCASALLPLLVTVVVSLALEGGMERRIDKELDILAMENVSHIAKDFHALCQATNEMLENHLAQTSTASLTLLDQAGFAMNPKSTTTWEVVNENTGTKETVQLPQVTIGGQVLSPTPKPGESVPVVDTVGKLLAVACSIYVRLDESGNMVRVATNILSPDGSRSGLGSYIPVQQIDGAATPMIAPVLQGQPWSGHVYLHGGDWLVRYDPLRDATGRVSGMIGVGLKIEAMSALRQAIKDTVVGKTGYVWVLGAKGEDRGRYLVSREGERDGDDVWEAKDANGQPFVQNVIRQALSAAPGEVSFISYPWQNPGEASPREKISAFTYFAPWDWVIGAGTYEDDYRDAKLEVRAARHAQMTYVTAGGVAILVLVLITAVLMGIRLSRPIRLATTLARRVADGDLAGAEAALAAIEPGRGARFADESDDLLAALTTMVGQLNSLLAQVRSSGIQVTSSATEIAASARQLEGSVNDQTGATSEVTATTRQIAATAHELAKTVEDVGVSAASTADMADAGLSGLTGIEATMAELMGATGQIAEKLKVISQRAEAITQVVGTMGKVANQTNLLSLNAAIEAEKAGELGLGFSVVAREIRRLADQTGVAAKDIGELVRDMQSAVRDGVAAMDAFGSQVKNGAGTVGAIGGDLRRVIEAIRELTPRFSEVSESVQLQSHGADQISQAMVQLSDTATATRESLTEFKRAAEQLSEAVSGLHAEVARFNAKG
jgi:methyl-accepting chemotaxis protein WspA